MVSGRLHPQGAGGWVPKERVLIKEKVVRLTGVASVTFVIMASTVSAAEWWQGSFAGDQTSAACEDNDSRVTYSSKDANFWEESCTIQKKTKIAGFRGLVLDMKCYGEGEDLGKRREMLLDAGDGKIFRYPSGGLMRRCDAPPSTASACKYSRRIYRATDPRTQAYQGLQFGDGVSEGNVSLLNYVNDQPSWEITGKYVCSMGESICTLNFMTTAGTDISIPYEMIASNGDKDHTVAAPSLRQNSYIAVKHSEVGPKGFIGLDAALLNGFTPNGNALLPYNVYEFNKCLPEPAGTKKPFLE